MAKLAAHGLSVYYGGVQAVREVSVAIQSQRITAIIGPSGCGKSTLLRVFNRMNDLVDGCRVTGQVHLDGEDLYAPERDVVEVRRRVGMVFQRPNPFPLSVFENVAFALTLHQAPPRPAIEQAVEEALRAVLLWDALKDRLRQSALQLTLEQQQRLCIARLLPIKPDVLLMDEPCSALDPVATQRIEELMHVLKQRYTIVIVTHNMQQAARVSDDTGFMLLGELVEFGVTPHLFTAPLRRETEAYITGRFG